MVKGTSSASLTLENIILDDAGKKCGEYFAQPSTDWSGKTTLSYKEQGINKEIEVPNTNIVQDAIVAAYGTNVEQPNAEIVLGKGAVLKDCCSCHRWCNIDYERRFHNLR